MPEVNVSALDRLDIAMSNALQGNLGAAGAALLNPDRLSPLERQTIAEKFFGLSEPGPLQTLVQTTTNPGVVLGLILTAKYPVMGTRQFFSQQEQFTKGLKPLIPLLDDTMSFAEIYRGTPLPALMTELGSRVHDFQKRGVEMIGQAALDFKNLSGKAPDILSEYRIALHRVQESGYLNHAVKEYEKRLGLLAEKGLVLPAEIKSAADALRSLPKVELSASERALNSQLDGYFDWVYDKTGPDLVNGIPQSLARKGRKFTGLRTEAPPIGTKLNRGYFPLLLHTDPKHLKALQDSYSVDVLARGAKESGLMLQGRPIRLTPSELNRLMGHYLADRGGGLDLLDKEAVLGGFREYVGEFIAGQESAATAKVASGGHLQRFFGMLPETSDLVKMGGPYADAATKMRVIDNRVEKLLTPLHGNPAAEAALQQNLGVSKDYILYNSMPHRFRMDTLGVAQSYNHTRARDYGWSVRPPGATHSLGEGWSRVLRELAYGKTVTPEGEILRDLPDFKDPVRAAFIRDTYMPAVLGNMTPKEHLNSQRWDHMRKLASDSLKPDAPMGKMLSAAGANELRQSLQVAIAESPKLGYRQATRSIANYFYQSTLAAPNLIAPVKNLFQILISTLPYVGVESTVQGIKDSLEQMNHYIKLRHGNVTHEEAFRTAFKDFAESAFTMDDSLVQALDQTKNALLKTRSPAGQTYDVWRRRMMSLFSTSETGNRIVAHNSFRHSAWKQMAEFSSEGVPVFNHWTFGEHVLPKGKALYSDAVANNLVKIRAMEGVAATQFGGGISNIPKLMAEWNPTFRMLSQFPIRYANLFARGGPGFWGRALVATGLTIGAAKLILGQFGEDIASQATTTGALPIPREGSPFYPLPLVPPVVQLAGSAAVAGLTGDPTQLQRSLPLLVPGGVGLARVLTTVGPGPVAPAVGQLIGRSYVDNRQQGPDGRYPLYTPDGNLIGYYSPTQLYARSLGLGDINGSQEQALARWMIGVAPRVAELKREYVEAAMSGDQRLADTVEQEYQTIAPGPIPISKSQWRGVHLRQDVGRSERLLETLPPELRAQFLATMGVAFGNDPGFLGLQPGGLSAGTTAAQRDPYRIRPSSVPPGSGSASPAGSSFMERAEATTNELLSGGILNSAGIYR